MVMTDPIADFLTRTRNVNMVKHEALEVPAPKIKRDIAKILKHKGLIHDVEYIEDDKRGITCVFLKYSKNEERVIIDLRRISKSGLRAYAKADKVPKVLNGLGIAIIPTSKGAATDKEVRTKNIDGEVIAYVW